MVLVVMRATIVLVPRTHAPRAVQASIMASIAGQGFGNISTYLNHDIQYDPVWRIYEKDYFALLQNLGFSNINNQSIIMYYFYQMAWGTFVPGGGSRQAKATDPTARPTTGSVWPLRVIPTPRPATTNQDQQNVSVRGQALLEWMQPAQDKKRMLFVPYRFVNR